MSDDTKRSLRDTIGQLIVMAILLALIVGAVLLARDYVDAHNSSAPLTTSAALNLDRTCNVASPPIRDA